MADLRLVKDFLKNHPHLELIKDNNDKDKVRCKLTNHELPCNVTAIDSYTKGKKYQRLSQASQEHEKYKEYLVPHNTKRNQLFCQLTKKSINNTSHHIKQHVTGKRFTNALAQSKASGSEEDEDTEMWVPSDLESDSELEEVGDDPGDTGEDTSKLKVSEDEENEEMDFKTNELSPDENEQPVVQESAVENHSSKAHRSKPAKRKNKQEQNRKIEENSEEITQRKKAKKGKNKHSPKNS